MSQKRHSNMRRAIMYIIVFCLLMALGYACLPIRARAITSDELQAQSAETNTQLDSVISPIVYS